jgi:glucose-1-phosphate adenylyltransferase
MEIPIEQGCRFGIVEATEEGKVVGFEEKPAAPRCNLASMGIYVFDYGVLVDEMRAAAQRGGHDFGKDIFPAMLGRRRLVAHRFSGYWRDVGTLDAYYDANMDLLDASSGLDPAAWRVRTTQPWEQAPAYLGPAAQVERAMVCRGSRVLGRVVDSVVSPGVVVEEGAEVVGSVVMHGCRIGSGASLHRAILDKTVVVGAGALVGCGEPSGPNRLTPAHLSSGLAVVGRAAQVPAGGRVGRNAIVHASVAAGDFPEGGVPSGATLLHGGEMR